MLQVGPSSDAAEVGLASLRRKETCATVGHVALRLMLVDDNRIFLSSAARLLQSQGAEIVGTACSSSEAVSTVASVLPDAVLVDVQLGEDDGLELARRLATSLPVILISAHPAEELEELIADSPAVGFIAKRSLGVDAIAALLG
jgi:CheY-like chemotaxis protein